MAKTVYEGVKHDSWFGLDGNSAIQGALATREGEHRVYIVTQPNEEHFVKLWPRLVGFPVALVKWDL